MDDARARAEALAARAGVTLGGPLPSSRAVSATQARSTTAPWPGAESAVPIEPGIDQISAALTVTFADLVKVPANRRRMRAIARPAAPPSENRILYEIISTVGSSLELEQVLDAVVRLLSDASAVHATASSTWSRTRRAARAARRVGALRAARRRDRARAR